MKELRLDDFLDSARADGTTDSEGMFTISHAQAVKKMALYSLPYPEAWVLKIVQAAVVWKASEIVITQTRLYTTIEFCPQEKKNVPSEREVVATLIGDTRASAIPVGNLCLALRTLVQLEDYSFILTLNNGRSEVSPLYAGRDAGSLPKMQRLRLAKLTTAGIKIVVIHLREGENLVGRLVYRFVPWLRRDRQIGAELDRCASVCSVPIHLNGRQTTDLLRSVNYGLNSETRPLLLSGVKSPGEPLLNLAVDSSETLLPYYSTSRAIRGSEGGRAEFTAWYMCQARRKAVLPGKSPGLEQTHHEIHWVCDGVVVQCDTFLLPTHLLRLIVFLNAEGLQTDITGMLLRDSEAKNERWGLHFELLKQELEQLSVAEFFPATETRKKRVEAPTVEEYLGKDFAGLCKLECPKLQQRSHPATRSYSRRYSGGGLMRTESGKYVSEVVRSRDGSSHLIIRANTKS